jgi:spoIIIJ-associated protein
MEGRPGTEREAPAGGGEDRARGLGATVGEAKWAAMKDLEQRFPGIDADSVRFEVVTEGDQERGEPAEVAAEVDLETWRRTAGELPEEPAERVRALVSRVCQSLGLRASVDLQETEDEIRATVNGPDLGLLIGKHGATIDALQHVAVRAAFRGSEDRKQVVVDAAGYRERREAALQRSADRAAADALSFGRPVELEPMSPQERKVVHLHLRDRHDVDTHSEGDEPERRVVVTPVRDAP